MFTRQTEKKKYSINELGIAKITVPYAELRIYTTDERTCGTPKTIFNMDLPGASEMPFNYKAFFATPYTFVFVCLFVCCA